MALSSLCCTMMNRYVSERVVHYDPRWDELQLPVRWHAGEMVIVQALFHCPWCGHKLPPSRRDEWFDRLEVLSIDPLGDPDDIPEAFRDGTWRKQHPFPL